MPLWDNFAGVSWYKQKGGQGDAKAQTNPYGKMKMFSRIFIVSLLLYYFCIHYCSTQLALLENDDTSVEKLLEQRE